MTKTKTLVPVTTDIIIAKRREHWEAHKDIEQDHKFTNAVAKRLTDGSDEARALIEEIKREPRLLIEMCFVIVDKEAETTPFFLNSVQRTFSNELYEAEASYRAGQTHNLRFLVLKGRQQGFTSYITAEQLARSIIRRNYSGFTVADNADNTAVIFEDKAKFPYSTLPDNLKPEEKYNNRRELHFEKLNSRWRIATASKDIGRSKTVYFLHISEAAFLPVPISSIQAAVGEALTKDAVQIYESTANGYNEFKDAWDSGKFRNCFYQWWETPEYTLTFESKERESKFKYQINHESSWVFTRCRWLREALRLSWEQVYWYFNKHETYIDGELIKQEYPCSADEAFLASGRCVFDQEKVIQRKEELARIYKDTPPSTGNFRYEWDNPETKDAVKNDSITFKEQKEGMIKVYERPKEGHPYVIGADTAGEGKDFYAATVIDNSTGVRVASLRARLTNSKPFTWQLYCLARYYNDALVGIETNFNTAPIEELERLGYLRQYVRRHYDHIKRQWQDKYGFKTDGNNRLLIIDKEVDLIENNIELFSDITFLDECLSFVYDENGRPDAEEGKHDDLLFSDMIANEIRSQQTYVVEEPEEEPDYEIEETDMEYSHDNWFA